MPRGMSQPSDDFTGLAGTAERGQAGALDAERRRLREGRRAPTPSPLGAGEEGGRSPTARGEPSQTSAPAPGAAPSSSSCEEAGARAEAAGARRCQRGCSRARGCRELPQPPCHGSVSCPQRCPARRERMLAPRHRATSLPQNKQGPKGLPQKDSPRAQLSHEHFPGAVKPPSFCVPGASNVLLHHQTPPSTALHQDPGTPGGE